MSETMLLIGADGYLGRHLARAGGEAGLEVLAATRRGRPGALACELLEPESVRSCLREAAPTLVVNAAGAPSVAASWERPDEAFAANAIGVVNLLEAVRAEAPAAHLACLSSAAVYGAPGPGELPLRESSPLRPVSPYGAAKAAMEIACEQYVRARGLSVTVLRAFNLLGPGAPPAHAASGIARRIAAAELAGEAEVEIALGNPEARRDISDAAEAARGVVAAARARLAGTFNLCSGRTLSVAETVAALAAATSLRVATGVDPALARPADPAELRGDPARLREAVGYAAAVPPQRSLEALLEWWRRELAAS